MAGRIAGLDLLRGLAIGVVLVRHSWPQHFGGGGIVGVVMFFALSGYLITGLLVKDLDQFGRIRYGRFYVHRASRLLPALFAMLVGYALLTFTADPIAEGHRHAVWGLLTGLTYTANIPVLPHGVALGHLWTLATEEQFYLFWPVLLALGVRFRRIRAFTVVAAAGVLAGLLFELWWKSGNVTAIYTMPFSWALAIIVGSFARLGRGRLLRAWPDPGALRNALSVIAGAVLLGLCFLPEVKDRPVIYLLGGPVIALCSVVLIFHLETWQTLPRQWLRPVLLLGTISYAAYLWNYPISKWLAGADHVLDGWAPAGTIALTLGAATVSWFVVEQPAQRWRRRVEVRHLGLDAAVTAPRRFSPGR